MSVAALLHTTVDTIPAAQSYLSPDPALVAKWRKELAPFRGRKIGIGWQGNPKNAHDRERTFPLGHFAAIAAMDDVHLFSLQVDAGREQLPTAPFPVVDLGGRFDASSLA